MRPPLGPVLFCVVLVAGAGAAFAVSSFRVVASPASSIPDRDAGSIPVAALSGDALSSRVTSDLRSINTVRAASRDPAGARPVVVEGVSYERSAGGVVARGTVRDLGAPRDLRAVIDGYGDRGAYVTSGESPLRTAPGQTSFSVYMDDRDEMRSFGVRFLQGGDEVPRRSAEVADIVSGLPPVLADDRLFAADLPEAQARLASLGYATARTEAVDAVVYDLVSRFRRDRGMDGPGFASVGDLLALRASCPPQAASTNLVER